MDNYSEGFGIGGIVAAGNIGAFDYAILPPVEWPVVSAARDRDAQAESAIVARFTRAVESVATACGQRNDAQDIAQETFLQFFWGIRNGKHRVESADDCGKLLRKIAFRAVQHLQRKAGAAKRDARKTTTLLENYDCEYSTGNGGAISYTESPAESYPNLGFGAESQRLCEMLADGFSIPEAAREIGIGERRARRIIDRIRVELS